MPAKAPRERATLDATGEMAARVAAFDWAATPLGPRECWPQSLKVIVATMLASQFPMAVRWGPDFVQIYNDGYRPILGDKHPDALGRPVRETWPETQAQVGPLHQAILAGERGAFFSEDMLLRLQRRGDAVEEAHFTLSYSPIADESAPSGVGGVLITAVETTARVWVERRLREREAELARVQEIGQIGGVTIEVRAGFRSRRSPEYRRIHGLPPETTGETYEEWMQRLHPEDREF